MFPVEPQSKVHFRCFLDPRFRILRVRSGTPKFKSRFLIGLKDLFLDILGPLSPHPGHVGTLKLKEFYFLGGVHLTFPGTKYNIILIASGL